MANTGYTRNLTFTVNDKQIKKATDRLFQSLDRIEKKLDVIAGRGRGSRTGFIQVQKQIEGTNKELALLTKTASTAQSKFNNLQTTFELFSKAVYGLNQARLITQKGLKVFTDDARTGFLRLNREIGKTYLMLDPKKRVQLGGQFKDLIEYRSMQGAGPGSPQFRNDGRLRGSGYSTRKSLAGIGGDGPYSFMYPVNTGGFGGNTFRYEMNKKLALRQQGLERGGTGFASFSRDATYESAWQREFRARLQDQVDRRNFNQAKNLQVQTARLSEAGGGVASGASLRTGASDPIAKSIRRHRERMDKLRKVELKTTKQLLGTEKQIVAVKKTQALQVNATAYAPGAIGPRQSLYNRLGFGAAANPQGVFANSRGIAGRRANAVSSGLIGGFFPLLFGQGGMAAGAGAVGGAAGGALGGAFGFAGSIAATAVAQKIQEAIDFRKEIDKVNKSITAAGGSSLFTASGIKQLGKTLNMTKEEALDAAKSFAAFDASVRTSLLIAFGDEGTFNLVKGLKTNKQLIEDIQAAEGKIGRSKADQLLNLIKTEGSLKVQKELQDSILEVQKKNVIGTKDQVSNFDRFMSVGKTFNRLPILRRFSGQDPGKGRFGAVSGEDIRDERIKSLLGTSQQDAVRQLGEELNRAFRLELITNIATVRDEIEQLQSPLFQLTQTAETVGNAFGESFKGIVSGSMTAQQALANLFQRTADHFLDMAAKMIAKQIQMKILGIGLNWFAGAGVRAAATDAGRSISDMNQIMNGGLETVIGGNRAAGGPVSGGTPYIVGEKGPELFVPGSSGNIVPNNKMGGVNIVVNVDASDSSVEGDEGQSAQLGNMLAQAIQSELVRQKRPGGLLSV